MNNGSAGVTGQNLNLLARLIEEESKKSRVEPALAMIFDEMNLKSKTRFVPHEDRVYGYVDFGDDEKVLLDPHDANLLDEENVARRLGKNALFFLVNGININVRMPIAYCLIDPLDGSQKAKLITEMIKIVFERGQGKVKVGIFDGDPAHFKMVEHLGGSFKIDGESGKIKSTIRIEGLDWNIHFMLDINHMLKLVRNHQEAKEVLYLCRPVTNIFSKDELRDLLGIYYTDEIIKYLENDFYSNRKIEWKYLIKLHEYQESTGIRLNNQITRHHVNFRDKIMNVRLCAQTMSEKTGNSLLQCEFELELQHFVGSIYLALSFKIFDRVFRIFNSMHTQQDLNDGWNSPITVGNVLKVLSFLDSTELFIRSIKLENGSTVLTSKIKTGFVGIIVGINVVKNMCHEFIESGEWDSFSLYSISQDLIEMFFGFIRLRLGCNDNPDAYELSCTYKNILSLSAMHTTKAGNCELRKCYPSLNSSNQKRKSTKVENISFTVDYSWKLADKEKRKNLPKRREKTKNSQISLDDSELFTQYATSLTASKVQSKVLSLLDCRQCIDNLQDNELSIHPDIEEICRKSEFIISIATKQINEDFTSRKTSAKILSLMRSDILAEVCNHSHGVEDLLDGFRFKIIKFVISEYVKFRAKEIYLRNSINLHSDVVRHVFKKLTLFKNQ